MIAAASTRRDTTADLPSDVVRSDLQALLDGRPISTVEACRLLRCDDEFLPDLLAAAQALKERFHPGVVTYSRKVFIPLTNICRDYCGYCAFRRDPGEPGAHTI